MNRARNRAYVSVGTGDVTGYPRQAPAVIVIDLQTYEIERVVDTSEIGPGGVGVIRSCEPPE